MARDTNRPGLTGQGKPEEAELADRLRRLDERLEPVRSGGLDGRAARDEGGDPGGLAKAMRLSTEFVAGIIAGALLGWVVDRYFGTSPWGLIVLLMLGFGAGLMNVMRAAGMLGRNRPKG